MSTYFINEASFDVSNEWVDQSVNIFSSSRDIPSEFSFVVSRAEPIIGEELSAYVVRQHEYLHKQLPLLRILWHREILLDGIIAMEAEFTWVSNNNTMYQRQVYVIYGGKVLTLTATTQDRFYEKYEGVLDQIVESFRFHQF